MKSLIRNLMLGIMIFFIMPLSAQQISFSVDRIWENENHCAFTSLIQYKGEFYCAFREGASHIFDKDGKAEGKIRILCSSDGKAWRSVALIGKEGCDLRDPKISITPDNRMLITLGCSIYRNRKLMDRIPHIIFSSDGRTFSQVESAELDEKLPAKNNWIWRVTWHKGIGYAVNYAISSREGKKYSEAWLLKTKDGKKYEAITKFDIDGFPNETTLRFLSDGRMASMVRRETGDKEGWFGISTPPYKEWEWVKMGTQLGGQDFFFLEDNHVLMCSRNYSIKGVFKTSIYRRVNDGPFEEIMVLPSGKDCSYPGMLVVGDELWISYYSTHATPQAAIYLAKIPLKTLREL